MDFEKANTNIQNKNPIQNQSEKQKPLFQTENYQTDVGEDWGRKKNRLYTSE